MTCEGKGSVTVVREFFEADGGKPLTNTELLGLKTKGVQELAELDRFDADENEAITALYVKQTVFPLGAPQSITVTIEAD